MFKEETYNIQISLPANILERYNLVAFRETVGCEFYWDSGLNRVCESAITKPVYALILARKKNLPCKKYVTFWQDYYTGKWSQNYDHKAPATAVSLVIYDTNLPDTVYIYYGGHPGNENSVMEHFRKIKIPTYHPRDRNNIDIVIDYFYINKLIKSVKKSCSVIGNKYEY